MLRFLLVALVTVFALSCESHNSLNDAEVVDFDSNENMDTDFMDIDQNGLQDADVDSDIQSKESIVTLKPWTRIATNFPFRFSGSNSIVKFKDRIVSVSRDKIYVSENGKDWTVLNDNAPFTKRIDHAVATLNDRLFVIGGRSNTPLGDAWSSSDGKTWDRMCSLCPFGARYGLSAIEFKGVLWVIGGIQENENYSEFGTADVWSSTDGKKWKRVVDIAPFGVLSSQSLIIHDNALWLFATSWGYEYYNSVWRSTDGINWEKIADVLPFSPKKDSSFFSWKEKLWIVGGKDKDFVYLDEIWYSKDGIKWEKNDSSNLTARSNSATVVTEDKVFLISGYNTQYDQYVQEIISTDDGKNWTSNLIPQSFSPRFSHTVTRFKDRFWIIGGRTHYSSNGNVSLDNIYSSSDGANWELALSEAPFGYRLQHGVTVFKDKLWLVGGFWSTDKYSGDVWSSGNGIDWKKELDNAPFDKEFTQEMFVFNDELVLVGRENNSYDTGFWFSSDGVKWKKDGVYYSFLECLNNKFAVHNSELYMVGGCNDHINGNEVWKKNADGKWDKIATTNVFTPRRGHIFLSMGGFLWVIGGSDGVDLSDVWYSKDGSDWHQAENAEFEPRACHAAAVFDSQLWVFGGFEYSRNETEFGDVWVTGIENVIESQQEPSEEPDSSNVETVDWESATENMNSLSGRSEHTLLHTENGFYILGGIVQENMVNSIANTVLYSSDGKLWKQLGPSQPLLSKRGMAFVYFKGQIWGIGGQLGSHDISSDITTNEIVVSDDGENWSIAVAYPEFAPRWNHNAVVFQDKIWVVGGFDNDGDGLNDIWSSLDGLKWTRENTSAEFSGRGQFGIHVFNDSLYIIGGMRAYYDDKGVSDVWVSSDGTVWKEITNIAFQSRTLFGSAKAGGALWIFGGVKIQGEFNDLIYSFDGIQWHTAESDPSLAPRSGAALWGDDDRLWLSGGFQHDSSYMNFNDVWYADLEL